MKVFLDISGFWPKDEAGEPRTVNSIYEELKGSPNQVSRDALALALRGKTDRMKFDNLVKLARLASEWTGKEIRVDDLLKEEA